MSLQKQALLDFLNPLPTQGIPDTTVTLTERERWERRRQIDQMLKAATAAGLGWFGTMFAARMALHGVDSLQENKAISSVKADVNARFPRIALNPKLLDSKSEEAIRNIGVSPQDELPELGKQAASDTEYKEPSVWDPLNKLYTSVTRTDVHPLQIAAALSASVGGGYAGYRLADALADRMRSRQLDKRIATDREELNKLMYSEYVRTRGLGKVAAEQEPQAPETDIVQGLKSLYPVYFVAALALAFKSAKSFTDNRDPGRQRLKDLKTIARERALVTDAPMLIDDSSFPSSVGGLQAAKGEMKTGFKLPSKNTTEIAI